METLLLRFTVSYAWALGCAALHVVAAFILRPRLISRLELLSKKEARALPNLVVAAVHAMTLFVASMRHLRAYWSQDAGVLLFAVKSVTPMAPAEAFWCCAMIGYLLYDTGLVILNGADEGFDMAAHHVLGLVSWGSLRLTDYGGIYLMWVHLAEVSVPVPVRRAYTLPTEATFVGLHPMASPLHCALQLAALAHCAVQVFRAHVGGLVHADSHSVFDALPRLAVDNTSAVGAASRPVLLQPLHHSLFRGLELRVVGEVVASCLRSRRAQGAGRQENKVTARLPDSAVINTLRIVVITYMPRMHTAELMLAFFCG